MEDTFQMARRLTLILGLVMTLAIIAVPVAVAHDGTHASNHSLAAKDIPTRIDLPNGFQPEGITAGFHNRLYVGSLANGAIWRGNARTGEGKILVAGVAGRQAAGLHLDGRARLWVAGGGNHTIRVYNALTGRLLETYTFPTDGFINDLVITRKAVYATDSSHLQFAVVPLGRFGRLPDPSAAKLLPLTGEFELQGGFNANGIVARDGWLILVQGNAGKLFRVDPKTGDTRAINTGGYSVANGDGLALRNGKLYVVRNFSNLVAVLNLGSDLLTASLVGEITSPGNLDVPTTATFALRSLWVVNARFSTPPTPTTPYWITRLPTTP
jgi:strictosidine synthase-like protein